MQYIFLKNILETILTHFNCPQCHNKTNESSIQITGISSHGIDIHVHCHICGVHSQLNAEINSVASQMLESEEGKNKFQEFLKNGGTIGAIIQNNQDTTNKRDNTIKDEDIMKIHNDLKNAKSIEDFMNE